MPLPHRNNPPITANWVSTKSGKCVKKTKKAYYEISATKKPGKLDIILREEKKRLGGSREREEFWFSYLDFDLDSSFAKDLKMFLNEYVKKNAPEEENIVRIYFDNNNWCARYGKDLAGTGEKIHDALVMLAAAVAISEGKKADAKKRGDKNAVQKRQKEKQG